MMTAGEQCKKMEAVWGMRLHACCSAAVKMLVAEHAVSALQEAW